MKNEEYASCTVAHRRDGTHPVCLAQINRRY